MTLTDDDDPGEQQEPLQQQAPVAATAAQWQGLCASGNGGGNGMVVGMEIQWERKYNGNGMGGGGRSFWAQSRFLRQPTFFNFTRSSHCIKPYKLTMPHCGETIRQTICHVNHFSRSILKIFPLEPQSPGLDSRPRHKNFSS